MSYYSYQPEYHHQDKIGKILKTATSKQIDIYHPYNQYKQHQQLVHHLVIQSNSLFPNKTI